MCGARFAAPNSADLVHLVIVSDWAHLLSASQFLLRWCSWWLAHVCIRIRASDEPNVFITVSIETYGKQGFTHYPLYVDCRAASQRVASTATTAASEWRIVENFNVSADAHKWQSTIASTRAKNEKTYALMPWCLRVLLIPPEEAAKRKKTCSKIINRKWIWQKKKIQQNEMMPVETKHL